MNTEIRKQILREFPELAAGYHIPVAAIVTAVADTPTAGGIADNYRPRYAVDVELIDSQYQKTGIKLEAVPVAITGGGDERGFFALPKRETLVELAWLNASPERPFIRSVLADRLALPALPEGGQAWQQNNETAQTVDAAGNWTRSTPAAITDQAHEINQLADHLKQIVISHTLKTTGHSKEQIEGIKTTEATALHNIAAVVINQLTAGSLNQLAAKHITRAAGEDIRDRATNYDAKAKKIYLGTDADNILKIISDALKTISDTCTAVAALTVTCAASGSPSSVPVNVAAFTALKTTATALKTKIDGMTL